MQAETRRETFSSLGGTVLATAGVAIGLGNVWRFPYMMGLYGGAAFLLLYLGIVLAFGIPALICEWALGRATRSGPLGAFRAAGLSGARLWGGLLLLTVTLAASYYGVVVSWVFDYLVIFLAGRPEVGGRELFAALTASTGTQLGGLAATVGVTCLMLHFGVRRGIERVSKAVLPLFFALFIVLIGRSLTLPGATAELAAYLRPDWGAMGGGTVLAALGQAFFSLALGGTFMVVYGSYLKRDQRLPAAAAATALTDAGAAVAAALVVVPAVLVLGHDLASGPSLMFEVMPDVFSELPAGALFGALFFASVLLVALLSLAAAYQVLVAALTDHAGWGRGRALAVVATSQLVLALPALLGLPGLFGLPPVAALDYLRWSDFVWGSTMQPLGGALAVVALVWCHGRARALEALGVTGVPRALVLWVKWVIPGGILATLAYGWWETLFAG